MKRLSYLILLISILHFQSVLSQVDLGKQSSQAVIIDLEDGSVIYGIISNKTDTHITIQTNSLNEITIPIKSIVNVKYIDDVRNILFDKNDHPVDFYNSTHYFLFQSGYSLKKGQSYYENFNIFFNSYSHGISDNFSISAGGEIATLLSAAQFPLVFVSPKFSLPFGNQKGALGIGATVFTIPGTTSEGFGFLSSSLTLGSRNNNVTFGVGAGFSFSGGITDEVIPFNFSFMKRISKKISLLSENYIISSNDFSDAFVLGSFGLRIHFKQLGNVLNFGLTRPLNSDFTRLVAFPFVSATIAFGN